MSERVNPEDVQPGPAGPGEPPRTITVLGRTIRMPRSRALRVAIGILMIVFGLFGFLPVLGFWMIPVGFFILSYEFAMVRRWRRRLAVRFGRRSRS